MVYFNDPMWRPYDAFKLQAIALQVDYNPRPVLRRSLSLYRHPQKLTQYLLYISENTTVGVAIL